MGFGLGPDCGCCFTSCAATPATPTFYRFSSVSIGYHICAVTSIVIISGDPCSGILGATPTGGYLLVYDSETSDRWIFKRPSSKGYPYITAEVNKTPYGTSSLCANVYTHLFEKISVEYSSGASLVLTNNSGSIRQRNSCGGCVNSVSVNTYNSVWACPTASVPTSINVVLSGQSSASSACAAAHNSSQVMTLYTYSNVIDGYATSMDYQGYPGPGIFDPPYPAPNASCSCPGGSPTYNYYTGPGQAYLGTTVKYQSLLVSAKKSTPLVNAGVCHECNTDGGLLAGNYAYAYQLMYAYINLLQVGCCAGIYFVCFPSGDISVGATPPSPAFIADPSSELMRSVSGCSGTAGSIAIS